MQFRYRYVGFGTTFEGRTGNRPQQETNPSLLYENEIALDVGSTCWGRDGEILPVIDHHFQREDQFPSAATAVLHNATLIFEKFGRQPDAFLWLVSHQQADFDAFCSMYLVRRILELGMTPTAEAFFPVPEGFDWFHPDLQAVPAAARWRFLLASYASHVDNGRRIACPKQRALHSILYAALYRGRDYRSESSGATEFFDEVCEILKSKQLNPLFDSVLEGSTRFQPELVMLENEVDAYRHDVQRARKSTVYLQKGTAPFEEFFRAVERVPLLSSTFEPDSPHAAAPTEAREQADAIYLKDPECLLFKEWARLDLENSSMGTGFTFTAVVYSGERLNNQVNRNNYFFSLDPERANGRHLYGLWARLEAAEVKALHKDDYKALKAQLDGVELAAEHTTKRTTARLHFEGRAGKYGALFGDPWFDGNNYAGTIIGTPNRGTFIGPGGWRADLLDDPIVDIVRKELEHSIFASVISVTDLPAKSTLQRENAQTFEVGQVSAPPAEGYFRLAMVELNPGVDFFSGHTGQQIGEALWQTLYPKDSVGTPTDFLTRHLIISSDWLGIWSRRGIVIAYKDTGYAKATAVKERFTEMVDLAASVEAFIETAFRKSENKKIHDIVAEGEELTLKAAQLTHQLTLPDSRLLSRFFEALGLRELIVALRDLNLAAADKDRQSILIKYGKTVADVQVKLEMLEVLIFTVYGAELGHMLLPEPEHASRAIQLYYVLGGGFLGLLLGITILKPNWEHFLEHWHDTENKRSHSLLHVARFFWDKIKHSRGGSNKNFPVGQDEKSVQLPPGRSDLE